MYSLSWYKGINLVKCDLFSSFLKGPEDMVVLAELYLESLRSCKHRSALSYEDTC